MCNTSKKAEEMKEGTFASFYGQKFFCKVKQALGIGKVHFSFVEIGKKGEGVDIYVNADDFDILCDDILNGRLQKKMAESQSKYPDAWKYATGTEASKQLAIGKGDRMPVIIQGYDSKKNKRINVGVMKYDEMRIMAKWWKRLSTQYYEGLVELCLKASNGRPTVDDEKSQPQAIDEPVCTPQQEAPKQEAPKVESKHVTMQVTAKHACQERPSKKGDFSMMCCEGTDVKTGKSVNVVIPAEAIAEMQENTWQKFLERSADRNTPLSFKAVFKETEENGKPVFIFESFAK